MLFVELPFRVWLPSWHWVHFALAAAELTLSSFCVWQSSWCWVRSVLGWRWVRFRSAAA